MGFRDGEGEPKGLSGISRWGADEAPFLFNIKYQTDIDINR